MNRSEKGKDISGGRMHADVCLHSALLDDVAEGVFVWDKNGKCTEVNRTGCNLLGYRKEEILGAYFLDFIHKEDLAGSVLNIDDAASGRQGTVRTQMQRRDGTLFPVEMRQRLLADGSVFAIVSDTTSKRAAEEQIKNAERLYATLNGINHAIVRTKDRISLFEAVCNAAVAKGGFTLAMVGLHEGDSGNLRIVSWQSSDGKRPLYMNLDIARPPLNRSLIGDAMRAGKVIVSNNVESFISAELSGMKKPVRELSSAACIPLTLKGQVTGIVLLARSDSRSINGEEKSLLEEIGEDLSFAVNRMETEPGEEPAQRELTTSEEMLRGIIEQMNDAVIIVASNGVIGFASQGVERIIGYEAAEVAGKHFKSFLTEDDWNKADSEFDGILKSGEGRRSVELRLKKKGGRIAYCEIDAAIYKSDQSAGVIGVVRDISDRKKAEEDLRLLGKRRRELERQLLQAQRLESLGTLAGGLAHDFNNLLGIITGYSMLLRRKKPGDTNFEKGLDSIRSAAERGTSLVRKLLTIARRTETVFTPTSINDVLKEVIGLLSETFPKSITISTQLRENLPAVIADSNQLHQMFINLFINARDAMQMGGTLSISTSVAEGAALKNVLHAELDRKYAVVRIADTGTGMNEETRHKIFDPFFTTKMPGKGTGLGLALVYSIVEGHEGMIDVESEEGKGTAFSIYFPVEKSESVERVSFENETEEVRGGKETILVIEDEEMLLDIMRNFLVPNGYSVMGARDGEEGIAAYTEHADEIDLVVLDLGLPKVDGLQVMDRIRFMKPEVKIVIASGFVDSETQENLLKAGISYFIPKPYSLRQVLTTVRMALDFNE